jgi:8-oxo-dGDP phosphatase
MTGKAEWLKPHGKPWRRVAERPVYDNRWMAVREYDAVAPTGAEALYGLVHFKNYGIAILPLHDDGTVTLVGQNRFALGYSWELPEGGGPIEEDPLDSARRELREEAGLEAADWRLILKMQLSNSLTDERAFGYLATGLTAAPVDPDDTEDIAIARVPFPEALRAATEGEIEDALTVAMLLRAYHMASKGQLPGSLSQFVLG